MYFGVNKDVLLFVIIIGMLVGFVVINIEGMKCWGFESDEVMVICCVYKMFYCKSLGVEEVIVELVEDVVKYFVV